MADVTLVIGERRHTIACRAGEERHFERLAARLNDHWPTADRAAGGMDAERAMMFLALILADQLDEIERAPPPGGGAGERTLARVAEKLEALAGALEQSVVRA